MNKSQWHPIRTEADVQVFDELSNGLHDGYITHVEFHNGGICPVDSGLKFDYDKRSLVLHVLVTSLKGHPVFELSFRSVLEYQIQDYGFSDMIGFSVVFLNDRLLLWADDICRNEIPLLKQGTYVIAKTMEYRML